MQNDLISRLAVEQAIKEFNKKRISKIPKGLSFEEHNKILDIIEEENGEMLKSVNDLPIVYNVEKVVEQMKETGKRVCVSVHYNDECQDCEHGVLMCNLLEIVRNGGKE